MKNLARVNRHTREILVITATAVDMARAVVAAQEIIARNQGGNGMIAFIPISVE